MNARKQEKRNIDTWELENYAENYSEYICFQLQSQQWGVRHQIQIKGFLLKYFKTVNLVIGYHNHLNLFIPKQIKESGFNRHTWSYDKSLPKTSYINKIWKQISQLYGSK